MPIPSGQDEIIKTSAKERVYNTLQGWIIDGTMQPQERISDADLAQYFSVSRTPVREAIQMLIEQGLVYSVPSSGTFVSPIDKNDMVQLYFALSEVQTLCLSLGFSSITDAVLDKLSLINNTFLHNLQYDTPVEVMNTDREFHTIIAELSDNSYLVDFTSRLMLKAYRHEILFFCQRVDPQRSYRLHEEIIDLIRHKDLCGASKKLKENWKISVRE